MVLYVNACVRKESRTDRLARHLLQKLGGKYVEVRLSELDLEPLSEECLRKRCLDIVTELAERTICI